MIFKNTFQEKAFKTNHVETLIAHSRTVDQDNHEDKLFALKELLNSALILEFATIPVYLQAMWSIKDNNCEVASQRPVINICRGPSSTAISHC